ncbi:MAG TPA: winged helix-turn-helix domain-containing protein [Edaphobacter sp.]|nr:winged helix-turn-helix domain-containing protein [Edaphobacter sp.]
MQVKLQQQPFQVLKLLLEHPGEFITRERIRRALWPDNQFVDFEQSISTAVLRLRRALRENTGSPVYIESVARKGYRFIAPIAREDHRQSEDSIRAIAVLPFQDFTNADDAKYFVDGFTDSLVTEMALRSDLRVVPRITMERYKNAQEDSRRIAHELDVQAVVEGSILRSGDRIRISARLLHVIEERHLWAQTYDRDVRDILLLQQEIVNAIVTSTSAALKHRNPEAVAKPITPEAYESFLRGNFLVSFRAPQSLEKAFTSYQRAIDLEPEWAPPYAALAEAHRVADFPKYILSHDFVVLSCRLTARALALDPDNAQAHATMGAVKAIYEWRWAEGEEQIRKALSLSPQSSQVEHLYSVVLLAQKKYDEALLHANKALSIEHSSLFLRSHRVQVLHFARRIDEAVAESIDFLDEHPDFAMGLLNYGAALLDLGRAAEALPVVERLFSKTSMPAALCAIAHARYELGQFSEAKETLSHLYKIRESRGCSPMIMALGHIVIDEREQALEWLEQALKERDYRLVLLGGIIPFDKIRDATTFKRIFQQIFVGDGGTGWDDLVHGSS